MSQRGREAVRCLRTFESEPMWFKVSLSKAGNLFGYVKFGIYFLKICLGLVNTNDHLKVGIDKQID